LPSWVIPVDVKLCRTGTRCRRAIIHAEGVPICPEGPAWCPTEMRVRMVARRGAFHVVVVFRFDRFARSVKQLVLALEEFRSLGIDFISYQEALDTSTPMGKAMFTIIAAVAELERNVITGSGDGGTRLCSAAWNEIRSRHWATESTLSEGSGERSASAGLLMASNRSENGCEHRKRPEGFYCLSQPSQLCQNPC
jgi:hypothetical protein